MPFERIINLFVKVFTFFTKSLTIFYLAKVLDEESFGKLGLIAAVTIYYIYIAGMELHTISNREFIESSEERKVYVLINLFTFYLFSAIAGYFIVLKVLDLLELSKLSHELYLITLIILTEHLALEVYRLLVASQKQLIASFTYLVRAAWIFIIIYYDIEKYNITFLHVISLWLTFNVIGGVIGMMFIVVSIKNKFRFTVPDFKWIIKSLSKSIPFLFAALSLGGLSSLDRILISDGYSLKTLAGYVFYISVFNAIYSLVEATIYVYSYPKLILHKKNNVEFNYIYKRMWIESLCLYIILVCIGYLGLPYILSFIGKPSYAEFSNLYLILIIVMLVKLINANFQYYLYALRIDKLVYISNITMTPVFLTFYLTIKEYFLFEGIIYSIIAAYLLNVLLKLYFIIFNSD